MKLKFENFFDFKNKNIYVIGGSGLIGREIIKDLIRVGAKVICLDNKKPKSLFFKRNNFDFLNFDCEDILKQSDILEEIFNKKGKPFSLINCSYPRDQDWTKNDFRRIKFDSFKKNIELHLYTYIWIAKKTGDYMIKKKISGNILLFSSIYGFLGQDLNLYERTQMRENMTYSIIKGAIINNIRQMSSFYGKYKIRVNSISPGGLIGHNAGNTKFQNKNFIKNYSNKVPLRRLGKPAEISKSVVFLVSPRASYITGTNFIVDGGISIV